MSTTRTLALLALITTTLMLTCAASIHLGDQQISALNFGGQPIATRYLGDQLIFGGDDGGSGAPGPVTTGLLQWLDAIDNTGSGHDSATLTWTDKSGNNNHGALTNYTGAPWAADNLPFNGGNQHVLTNSLPLTAIGTTCTIEIVVQSNVWSNYRGIAGDHTTHPGLVFGQYDSGLVFGLSNPAGTGMQIGYTVPSGSVPTGQRMSLVMVVEAGASVKIYKNGALITSVTTIAPVSGFSPTLRWTLGRAYNSSNRYLSGHICSSKVYNRALSPQEIEQNFAYENARYAITQ